LGSDNKSKSLSDLRLAAMLPRLSIDEIVLATLLIVEVISSTASISKKGKFNRINLCVQIVHTPYISNSVLHTEQFAMVCIKLKINKHQKNQN